MKVALIVIDFFAFIGILFTLYIALIGLHEYGHYKLLKEEGVGIKEVSFLGYTKSEKYEGMYGIGWVKAETSDYNYTKHLKWDCKWLNEKACGMLESFEK
jgi:hypothetical protein